MLVSEPVNDRGPKDAGRPPDPLSRVVEESGSPPSTEADLAADLETARRLLVQARGDHGYAASLPHVLKLVGRHPGCEALQVIAGHLTSEQGDSGAWDVWRGICGRFPDSAEAFAMLVRATLRRGDRAAAEAMVDRRSEALRPPGDENALLSLAFGLEELGKLDQAEDLLQRVVRNFPTRAVAWERLICLQETRGGLMSAQASAAQALAHCGAEAFGAINGRLKRQLQVLERFHEGEEEEGAPVSLRALHAVIAAIPARPAAWPGAPAPFGRAVMITGSLGPGGAERQVVTTAVALQRAIREGRAVGRHWPTGELSVACRSLAAKHGNDFFLGALRAEGVRVIEYARLRPYGGSARHSVLARLAPMLAFLPPRLREGLAILTEYLRFEAPDVAHIWQDGMIFAAGLAALFAGTPRIVLTVRTLPPTDRLNRWRRELEPIYRTLLAAPGVTLTANSRFAARRYEDWLGLPRASVVVIGNGVERLNEAGGEEEERQWREFVARTPDADFTIGAVMRLDGNKRPLEWLAIAERFAARWPTARFLIVGDGELWRECVDYTMRLNLAERTLFVGRTSAVGFWLARMDALLLLSRHEGMPNALIEAQLAGVPVVTTPAGGAPETVLAGRTGFILSDAEQPSAEEATEVLASLADMNPDRRREMGAAARAWAASSFSVEAMLQRTLDVFASSWAAPVLARTDEAQ